MTQNTSTVCPECKGLGVTLVLRGDQQFAAECFCRMSQKTELRLKRARIPKRYMHCSLQNFDILRDADPSLSFALIRTRGFVQGYPLENRDQGLLLTGGIGVGKTHLAVGLLRELIEQRGATGIFCDYRDLLRQIQNSYSPLVATTEAAILRPVFEADILVLDELGAVKPTDWVWDTVAHILNTRYNDKKITLVTTNYPNCAPALLRTQTPGADDVSDKGVARLPKGGRESQAAKDAKLAMREETLGDRIGERMRSRLQEMCVTVEMKGDDFRQTVRRASLL